MRNANKEGWRRRAAWSASRALLLAAALLAGAAPAGAQSFYDLVRKAERSGSVAVMVRLNVAPLDETAVRDEYVLDRRQAEIAARTTELLEAVEERYGRPAGVKRFRRFPYVRLRASAAVLRFLAEQRAMVTGIEEDRLDQPHLARSTGIVGAVAAQAEGFTGAGQALAILDTGVDGTHDFLGGRVAAEACFSTTDPAQNAQSLCPNGQNEQIGAGSGGPCPMGGCDHGTHVAGIAAGRGADFSGVAPDAGIIAIQIFSRFTDSPFNMPCAALGIRSPCLLSQVSDQVRALEHVFDLRNSFTIAAANLSLGGGRFTTRAACDTANPSRKEAMDDLRDAGIATVASSGNAGMTDAMGAPGCISTAVSVGSTDDGTGTAGAVDVVSTFSNSVAYLDLLAPGDLIRSSVPVDAFGNKSGTSMAAPHVTGAFAVLRQASPGRGVIDVLDALKQTGRPVTDARNGVTTPRIHVLAAVEALTEPVFGHEVFARNAWSLIQYRWTAQTGWRAENLSARFQNALAIASTPRPLAARQSGVSRADVFSRRPNGDLVHHWWTTAFDWSEENLTAMTGGQPFSSDPVPVVGYQSGVMRHDVFGRNGASQLIHYWWHPQLGWHAENLTTFTNGPLIQGNPRVVVGYQSGTMRHDVFARNGAGQLIHYWWHPQAGWHGENLTTMTNGPAIVGDPVPLVGYQNGTMRHDVFARSSTGRLLHYWWHPQTGWRAEDLTAMTGGSTLTLEPAALVGYQSGNMRHDVFGRNGASQLIHYWWTAQTGWRAENLTTMTGGPTFVDRPDAVVGYQNGEMRHDVFARSGASQLLHYWWTAQTGWRAENLTTMTGGPQILGAPVSIVSYQDGTMRHDVFARDAASHLVHYFWHPQTGWGGEDLTAFTAGPTIASAPAPIIRAVGNQTTGTDGGLYASWGIPSESAGGEPPALDAPSVEAAVAETAERPGAFELAQNHPNPFNPATRIRYAVPEAVHVRLQVFDAAGRLVGTLVDAPQEAGEYEVAFGGAELASGLYLYRIEAGRFTATRRMLLLK